MWFILRRVVYRPMNPFLKAYSNYSLFRYALTKRKNQIYVWLTMVYVNNQWFCLITYTSSKPRRKGIKILKVFAKGTGMFGISSRLLWDYASSDALCYQDGLMLPSSKSISPNTANTPSTATPKAHQVSYSTSPNQPAMLNQLGSEVVFFQITL